MASIRKQRSKWQVQFRRTGTRPVARSLPSRKEAENWARRIEVPACRQDRCLEKMIEKHYRHDVVEDYREEVTEWAQFVVPVTLL